MHAYSHCSNSIDMNQPTLVADAPKEKAEPVVEPVVEPAPTTVVESEKKEQSIANKDFKTLLLESIEHGYKSESN